MDFKDLTPAQREKLDACKTPEDVLALAKSEGVDLTDEQIEAISGGLQRDIPLNPNKPGKAIW